MEIKAVRLTLSSPDALDDKSVANLELFALAMAMELDRRQIPLRDIMFSIQHAFAAAFGTAIKQVDVDANG